MVKPKFNFPVPLNLKQAVARAAKAKGQSMATYVRAAIRAALAADLNA
jgi:predicted HicB family RNase H-like nuclease